MGIFPPPKKVKKEKSEKRVENSKQKNIPLIVYGVAACPKLGKTVSFGILAQLFWIKIQTQKPSQHPGSHTRSSDFGGVRVGLRP